MNKPIVSIIAAMDEKRGVGKGNDLLFKIPEDFKRMKELTTGHPLVMGRKTFESLGRLLPDRTHVVITRNPKSLEGLSYQPHFIVSSLEDGIERAKDVILSEAKDLDSSAAPQNDNEGEVFIFGGGEIFKEALEKGLVDRLYLTLVKGDYNADTFFPEYPEFKKVILEEKRESDGYKYKFLTLERD